MGDETPFLTPTWADELATLAAGTYGDGQKRADYTPPRPLNFSAEASADGQRVKFSIRDFVAPRIRRFYRISHFFIFYAPSTLLADPSTITDPDTAATVFAAADVIASVPSVGDGRQLTVESPAGYLGKAGWYFAVSVTLDAIWSPPTPPVTAPTGYTTGDSEIPPDVSGAQATLYAEIAPSGQTIVHMSVAAQAPDPLGSFGGYQLYLQNYRFMDQPVEWESVLISATDTGGAILSGDFPIEPDVPAQYNVGSVNITNASATVTGNGTNWNTAWADGHQIAFYGIDQTTTDGTEQMYANAISALASATSLTVSGGPGTWRTSANLPYAIYVPNVGGPGFVPHPVRVYFVSLSKTGTRRPDITNAPSVLFRFGITASPTAPLNPYNVQAQLNNDTGQSSQGAAVALTWKYVSGTANATSNYGVDHFNVYKKRIGTRGNPLDPAPSRPAQPYAQVPYDAAFANNGNYLFLDKNWNTDPSVDLTTPDTGFDFDVADPGAYVYWVTAANHEGLENRDVFWGTLDAVNGSPTVTYSGGDAFSSQYVGHTININGTDYTVIANPSPTTLTLDVNFAAATATDLDFKVSSTSGRVYLAGAGWAEGGPSLYGDDFLNRLFNSQFMCTNAAGPTDRPFATDHNSGYGAAETLGDGQPTYSRFQTDPKYSGAGTTPGGGYTPVNGSQNVQAAGLPPTYTGGRYRGNPVSGVTMDDNWSVWQWSYSGAPAAIPAFVGSTVLIGNGEVVLDPTGHTVTSDFSTMMQLAQRGKFADGMPLVLSFDAKRESGAASGGGVLLVQMVRYDARNFSNAAYSPNPALGTERDTSGGTISLTTVETDFQRFRVKGLLPSADPTRAGISVTNGSATITTASNDFDEHWIGCQITLVGTTTETHEIRQVTGGGSPTTRTTIVMDAAWGGATETVTATVTIAFTHYAFKIGVNGVFDKKLYIKAPMLNSGRLSAPYTSLMIHDDWPGSTAQTGGGGGYDPEPPGCVPQGTLVMTPDGERPIELMVAGNHVLSFVGGSLKPRMVERRIETTARKLYRIWIGGRQGALTCSESHRIKTPGRYVEARNLRIGDVVVCADETGICRQPVTALEWEAGPAVPVYSLTINGTPNYVAGGVVCHNKKPPVDIG